MMHRHRCALSLVVGLAACSTTVDAEIPTWEEFRESTRVEFEGNEIFIASGDIAVDEAQLAEIYDAYVRQQTGEDVPQGTGSIVNKKPDGADDVWGPTQRRNLTYCVSNEWGAQKARVVNAMDAAVRDWEGVAGVDFRYTPGQDANCVGGNTNVKFAVRPWNGGGACAFFPSGGGCVARTLVLNPSSNFGPSINWRGVFRHELGHILGLRHEHARPASNAPQCAEPMNWRALTPYDKFSVMHYPWCNGNPASSLSLSAFDVQGIRKLYPQ